MSRLGIQFSTANGQAVPAQGRREIAVSIPVYGKATIGFEVSEVDKLLLPSHQMARLGLFGWLGYNDGGLYDARGDRVIDLVVYNEVYWIPLWVKNSDIKIDDDPPAGQQQQQPKQQISEDPKPDSHDDVGDIEPKVIAEVSKVQQPPSTSAFAFRSRQLFPRHCPGR